ncbi:MAG: ATP-binding protein [Nitrospira sp.]|nr:ATP-binding protein [Nitrospira sp.]
MELKTKKDRSRPDLDESDAWQFSRALSGFANSDGGVLVWGIETDKEERASVLKPISSVADFEARLKKSLLNAVQPFVDGVQIVVILEEGAAGDGYVKVLVPRSEKTPHRAMRADREYFRRSTEGFYRMEHFDLEDGFGRRPHPALVFVATLVPRRDDDPHEDVHLALLNQGRGLAKYPGFTLAFSPDVSVVATSHGINNNSSINNGRPIVSYQDNIAVIHAVPVQSSIGTVTIKRSSKGAPLQISVRWYCEGMSERTYSGLVSPEVHEAR